MAFSRGRATAFPARRVKATAEGDTGALTAADGGEAAGVADAPGWVPGGAGGGLLAAAG